VPASGSLEIYLAGDEPQLLSRIALPGQAVSTVLFPKDGKNVPVVLTDTGKLAVLNDDPRQPSVSGWYDFPGASSLGVGDLDMDGALELVLGGESGLEGWGIASDGSWELRYKFETQFPILSFKLADGNADGLLDLFYIAEGEREKTLYLALAESPGGFGAAAELLSGVNDFQLADLNGDHLPELISATQGGLLLSENSGGSFSDPVVVTENDTLSCAVVTVDGGAALEVAAFCVGSITVWRLQHDMSFERGRVLPAGSDMKGIAACDLNVDGASDLLVWGGSILQFLGGASGGVSDFTISLSEATASPGEQVQLSVLLTNALPVQGYTLAVRYPPETFSFVAIEPAGPAAGADFVMPVGDDSLGEAVLGVIIEMFPPFVLPDIPPGTDQEVGKLLLAVRAAAADGDYVIACDRAPVNDKITSVVVDAQTIYPDTESGTIHIRTSASSFFRGDVDGSGVVDDRDRELLLLYLLGEGDPPVSPEAADVNADGRISIEDAFYLINYLYAGGPPPPP